MQPFSCRKWKNATKSLSDLISSRCHDHGLAWFVRGRSYSSFLRICPDVSGILSPENHMFRLQFHDTKSWSPVCAIISLSFGSSSRMWDAKNRLAQVVVDLGTVPVHLAQTYSICLVVMHQPIVSSLAFHFDQSQAERTILLTHSSSHSRTRPRDSGAAAVSSNRFFCNCEFLQWKPVCLARSCRRSDKYPWLASQALSCWGSEWLLSVLQMLPSLRPYSVIVRIQGPACAFQAEEDWGLEENESGRWTWYLNRT
jgi:hypothetical protein